MYIRRGAHRPVGGVCGCREQPLSINTAPALNEHTPLHPALLPSLTWQGCAVITMHAGLSEGGCFETALSTRFPNPVAALKRILWKHDTVPLIAPLSTLFPFAPRSNEHLAKNSNQIFQTGYPISRLLKRRSVPFSRCFAPLMTGL